MEHTRLVRRRDFDVHEQGKQITKPATLLKTTSMLTPLQWETYHGPPGSEDRHGHTGPIHGKRSKYKPFQLPVKTIN